MIRDRKTSEVYISNPLTTAYVASTLRASTHVSKGFNRPAILDRLAYMRAVIATGHVENLSVARANETLENLRRQL